MRFNCCQSCWLSKCNYRVHSSNRASDTDPSNLTRNEKGDTTRRTLLQLTATAATIGAMVVTGYTQSSTQPGGNPGATPGATQGTTQGTGWGTNTTNSSQTTGPNTASSNSATSSSASSSTDAANQLVEMNSAEVALARTASTKAQSAAVKSYA